MLQSRNGAPALTSFCCRTIRGRVGEGRIVRARDVEPEEILQHPPPVLHAARGEWRPVVDLHQHRWSLTFPTNELPHARVTAPYRISRVRIQAPITAEIPAPHPIRSSTDRARIWNWRNGGLEMVWRDEGPVEARFADLGGVVAEPVRAASGLESKLPGSGAHLSGDENLLP